ncbi:MAG: beta-lactamase family protein [Acidimicrobiia bacterium]|nr:beta-lactamase family protein [Acidimicrobiia bacterium]
MDVIRTLEVAAGSWPVDTVALGIVGATGTVTTGATTHVFPLASVTKILSAYAVLVAVEEETVSLDDPLGPSGPPGVTLRHLLAHAGGIAPDAPTSIRPPGTRRIYSNAGFDILAAHVESQAGISFAAYLAAAVFEPLGMTSTRLAGSAARDASSSLADLVGFVAEVRSPTLVSARTLTAATTEQFPGLCGVLPGFGFQDPNPWGLGFEIRGAKSPHWTGRSNSPRTFGHFGQAGSFAWFDPDHDVACCVLTDRPFGDWAKRRWPELSDQVLAALAQA